METFHICNKGGKCVSGGKDKRSGSADGPFVVCSFPPQKHGCWLSGLYLMQGLDWGGRGVFAWRME